MRTKILLGISALCVVFGFGIASSIPVEDVNKPYAQCNPDESIDVRYYLEDSVTRKPNDQFRNNNDAYISSTKSNIEIYRNGIITGCDDWGRYSNIVPGNQELYLWTANKNGCTFNIPSVNKIDDSSKSEAQIHYDVGFYQVGPWGPNKAGPWKLSYIKLGETNYTCYADGKSVSNPSDCAAKEIEFGNIHHHVGECINYRVDWCGDGVVQNGTEYNNSTTANEQCDDGNNIDGDGCSATCTIEEEKNYDLALRKTVSSTTSGPFVLGDKIVFDIQVINQGDVDATNVEVTDYIPAGLILNDGNWKQTGSLAQITIPSLLAGKSTTVSIEFKIDPEFTGTEIKNIAEISKDDGDDIDSTPDTDKDNDCNVINNEVAQTCPEDEDDHDVEVIVLNKPDLKITKELLGDREYEYGLSGEVSFKIVVLNSGNTTETIKIVDTMPASLDYLTSSIDLNTTYDFFNYTNNGIDYFEYSNFVLKAGEEAVVTVVGTVNEGASHDTTLNCVKLINTEEVACDLFKIGNKVTLTKDGIKSKYTSPDKPIYKQGEEFEFIINAINHGPNQIFNSTFHEDRAGNWPDASCVLSVGWKGNNDKWTTTWNNKQDLSTYVWYYNKDNGGLMEVGETVELRINVKIDSKAECVKEYKNTVTFAYTEAGENKELEDDYEFGTEESILQCLRPEIDDNTLDLDDGDTRVSTNVTCKTSNGEVADTIKVDCGNGKSNTYNDRASATYQCEYTGEGTYTASCYVNGETMNSCNSTISVDESIYGRCGNGRKDRGEQCDLGGREDFRSKNSNLFTRGSNESIGDWLEDFDGRDFDEYEEIYCSAGCNIIGRGEKEQEEYLHTPIACLRTNTPWSVMEDELMPFWRQLESPEKVFEFYEEDECEDDCSDEAIDDNKTLIKEESMKCTFKLYNGNNQQIDDDEIETMTVDCLEVMGDHSSDILEYFEDGNAIGGWTYGGNNRGPGAGGYNWWINKAYGIAAWFMDKNDIVNETYGEYKLVLTDVEFEYRDPNDEEWEDGDLYDRVCEVNFAVTRPYFVQQNVFGIDSSADFLDDFYDINGYPILNKTNLRDVNIVDESEYKVTDEFMEEFKDFKKKYEKLAIETDETDVKKVPGKNIYFVDKDTFTIQGDSKTSEPYTIIVNGDVVVKGSISTNGMVIADSIRFEEKLGDNDQRCEQNGQTVDGIFVALGGFKETERDLLNDDRSKERCAFGNLHVNGALIGDGIEDVMKSRRSHLNYWFWSQDKDGNTIKNINNKRRQDIIDGASLVIEYKPSLWTQLPPGAEELVETLDIYKN